MIRELLTSLLLPMEQIHKSLCNIFNFRSASMQLQAEILAKA